MPYGSDSTPEYNDSSPTETEDLEEFQDDGQDEEEEKKLLERLDSFGSSLSGYRQDSIAGRLAQGIEEVWLEDEEYYEGVDEVNRSETRTSWRQKPVGQGNISTKKRKKKNTSTIFPNITAQFVDSASARVADMLLPTDDRSWNITPTPVPERVKVMEADLDNLSKERIQNLFGDADPQYEKDAAKLEMDDALAKAEGAQKLIEDWHIECQWHAEVRTVIEDSARIGVGILKGPVPTITSAPKWDEATGEMKLENVIKPGSRCVNPWNFFPDPDCGDSIHNGSFVWERDFITKKQLRELGQVEGYLDAQILKCIKEGPVMPAANTQNNPDPNKDPAYGQRYEIWYYYGIVDKEDMVAGGCKCEDEEDPYINAMVTMVNHHVIKCSLNPLETGDFPYDVMPWRKSVGTWVGQGVARQCRPGQKILTGAARNLMDNAGLAAGPMIIYKQGVITPADKKAGIGPRKLFYLDKDSTMDVSDAITSIDIPMKVQELLLLVEFGMKTAEENTGLPLLMQGQQGNAPDTVGGMVMLNNNANSTLRRLARLFDDKITEPHIRRYYKWLLVNTDDDSLKGDFTIDARGSSALLERDIQNQEMASMLNLSQNPVYGIDPEKAMSEYLKSRRFNPKNFLYEDEERKEQMAQLLQPPPDTATQVQELRNAGAMQLQELRNQIEQIKEESRHILQDKKLAHDLGDKDRGREVALLIKSMEQDLASTLKGMEEQGADKRALDHIKAEMTKLLMTLDVQKQLNAGEVATPVVEPRGRAPDGQSFEK